MGDKKETIIWDVSENRKVPIKIDAKFPVSNPKKTYNKKLIYVQLLTREYNSGVYLIARKQYGNVAPDGAIVMIEHRTGSWKHVHHEYRAYFMVSESGEQEYVFKDLVGDLDVEARLKNLIPIDLSEFDYDETRAEIENKGWKISQYDPVVTLYYIIMKSEVSSVDMQIRRLQELIAQKERELEELKRQLTELLNKKKERD